MAITKAARTVVANVSNTAGGTQRGAIDLEAGYGGFLTIVMTNGGTGPAIQCTCNILVAHNSTLPSTGAAGTDWKTIASYGGGLTANAVTSVGIPIPVGVMALEVEFTGNTSQAVQVEAYMSEITAI